MERRSPLLNAAPPGLLAGLAAMMAAAWALLLWPALDMHGTAAHLAMPGSGAWTPANMLAVFLMWAVMMAAMMLPGAMPMLLLYDRLVRRAEPASAARRTTLFVAAYLSAWALFSLAAAGLQWGLQSALLLSPAGTSTSRWLTAVLFAAAGLYQLTPAKEACLSRCRSPLGFLTTQWRGGDLGALEMGLRHGALCVGCCWALMALAFIGGTMNLLWMALLTLAVALEKIAIRGRGIAIGLGALFLAGGLFYAVSGTP